jgi:FmdE, Molybdenum formylmethanofuran dehydrogenase operon
VNFPDFYEQAPVVRTRDPFAEMLGAAQDGLLEYHYVDAVRLAGHSCPTVAGAFLMGRAALAALYPGEPAERGGTAVHMPAPEHEGTTGVMAQVLTLLTGAASDNGFQGIQGRFKRKGLLSFAERREGEAITFTRLDTGTRVAVSLNVSPIPADPAQGARMAAILQDRADDSQRAAFANSWQDRVRRLLLEFADNPQVIRVSPA